MAINISKLGLLMVLWALFLALAAVGLNVPTVLLVIGSFLYLFWS